jgi:chaperonin GroES
MGAWQPRNDRILVERLEGRGVESITAGGIIIPATTEKRAKTTADHFRARVVAVGPGELLQNGERDAIDLNPGDEVLVYSFAEDKSDGSALYTGAGGPGRNQLFVRPRDIVCAVAA